jgi:hypothetical protein
MKKICFVLLCFSLLASCKKEMHESVQQASAVSNAVAAITTTGAGYWDSVFTRYGNGWTGGDVAVSYKLPDGRVMWLWGDSFLDTVYNDRHRPVVGFIHNQVTTMNINGGNFTTYYGGTKKNPLPYFQVSGSDYYWPCFAFMNNNNTGVYVFLDRVKAFGTGAFDFKVIGIDVAVLNYPSLSIQKIIPFTRDTIVNWSGEAFESSDGYVYLFGAESTKYNKYVHVARTSKSNPLNVTYWNGSTWTTNADSSVRVLGGVSEGFSFFQYQGKQYLLSQENLLGPNIYIWNAASPVGPFIKKRLVYTTPQKVGGFSVWTYNAKVHPEFITNNQLLVGYCTNSQTSNGLYKDADTYRPYFVWASNWQ